MDKSSSDYKERFESMTNEELVKAFNQEVGNSGWTSSRAKYLTALREEFINRNIDLSAIGNEQGLSYAKKIRLNGNIIETT